MIIKYDDKIYASWNEDCYMDDGVRDIDQLIRDMADNDDIETVDCCEIGSDDDWLEVVDNLVEKCEHGYEIPIEVIKG